ncbi:MAG: hypothetical protein LPK07_07315 [Hymenobacteraceae bacterium]|nr:hypothetical protein [Hymenobacteraceae bacterium]
MKNLHILTIIAPALALLAVGCSSPVAMQSTEYDDMYYSSTDKTEYVEPASTTAGQAYQSYDESAVQGQSSEAARSGGVTTDDYYADEYYDGRAYTPRDNWYRPNYSFVDPYWGSAYVPRHYSRFNRGFYDPFFYDPFYDPFFHDPFLRRPYWGSGLSISIGYNYMWGGGWNRPFYGSRWWPGNSFYHGYYSGFYGHPYGGFYGSPWVYDRPLIIGKPIRTQYGPRDARGAVVTDRVNSSVGGRPSRVGTEAGDNQIIGTENAVRRNARPSRTGQQGTVSPAEGTKNALPSRPSRTEYYRPRPSNSNESRPSRQPARINQQQERRISPTRENNSRTRTREYTPSREYRQQQRQSRPIENRPTYQPRRESVTPSRSFESRPINTQPQRSSSGSNSSGGGRPVRGQ